METFIQTYFLETSSHFQLKSIFSDQLLCVQPIFTHFSFVHYEMNTHGNTISYDEEGNIKISVRYLPAESLNVFTQIFTSLHPGSETHVELTGW